MKWDYWIKLYLETHCTARGLRTSSIDAYRATLEGFREYVCARWIERGPEQMTPRDVLEYLDYLRRERDNGASAINRQVTVLRNFYRAIVAMGYLEPRDNPMANFPKVKAARRKLPQILNEEEVKHLIEQPKIDTVLGLRDRAIMTILYGTGIRASECAGLTEQDIDWQEKAIHVVGKGGHERTVPLNEDVVHMLKQYRHRPWSGEVMKDSFFRSREGGSMSRNAIYERVRTTGRKARIEKGVSPHQLRQYFRHPSDQGRRWIGDRKRSAGTPADHQYANIYTSHRPGSSARRSAPPDWGFDQTDRRSAASCKTSIPDRDIVPLRIVQGCLAQEFA